MYTVPVVYTAADLMGAAEAPLTTKLGAAGYFMLASTVVQLSNKSLFTTYNFQAPLLVGFLQMLVIAPVCYTVARPRLDLATARACAPLAAVNVINLVSGLVGTGGLSVPMFIALRRFTLVCTVVLEYVMFNRIRDRATYAAVAIMVTGALIAAFSDLSFNLKGYLAVFGNDIMTALYLVLVKDSPSKLTTTGVLFYNAALSLPLLAVATAMSGEHSLIRQYPRLDDTGFRMTLAASAVLGLSINHSTFFCTRVNEPLLTSVAGSLKNIVMTVVGALLFRDFAYSHLNAAGLLISMGGAIFYATNSALKSQGRASVIVAQSKASTGRNRQAEDSQRESKDDGARRSGATYANVESQEQDTLLDTRRTLEQALPIFAK